LRTKLDCSQPETCLGAQGPLEIVHEGPVEVSECMNSIFQRLSQGCEMLFQEGLSKGFIPSGDPVLRDE
jgi:hypothetical protein